MTLRAVDVARPNAPILAVLRDQEDPANRAATTILAMKSSLINRVSDACKAVGANLHKFADAVSRSL